MRFGIAQCEITPPFPTPMAGYGGRQDSYDDVNDPLTFTALVLEANGRRALLGAADLCTFPEDGSTPQWIAQLAQVVGCPEENVLLNASHTHGGPLLPGRSIYSRSLRNIGAARQYATWLRERVIETAREAVGQLREGSLWYGEGHTALPMNRRRERNGQIHNAPNPEGPVDNRLQLLAVREATGALAGVGIRVSCHPVATGAQHRLTADYPGAWRAEFARAFGPRVIPFFLQGVGGDARPRHAADGERWRALKHAELPELGRELLADTLDVLTRGGLRPLDDLVLAGRLNLVQAPCERRYVSREPLEEMLKSATGYQKMYAEECLRLLETGEGVPDHAEFRVQTLWLTRDLALIGLDVEPLVGLGRFVETAIAPRQAMVLGYTNGCVSYLPDSAELARGGYEASSYLYEPWSGPLLPGVERLIADAVYRLE